MVFISIVLTQVFTESIFIHFDTQELRHSKRTWALQAVQTLDALYLVDSPQTVLLSKDNYESLPTHMSQTENILNHETQGKLSLPACAVRIDFSFFLKSCSQTEHVFLNDNFFFWTEKRFLYIHMYF